MKKILLAGVTLLIGLQLLAFSPVPQPVNERLLKNFNESYPNAQKVVWAEYKNAIVVSFVEEGILTRFTYNKNGEFGSSIRYYTERTLPYYLIDVVKNKYPRQKIFGVTEITAPSGILYYVKLEGPRYWMTIALDSQGVTTIEDQYLKAP